jgi:hypothetical protein
VFSAKVSTTVPTVISEAGVEEPRVPFTPECEVGLAVLNAADSNHSGEVDSVSFAAETIATSRDGVDITAPFFKDLLADSPVEGADAIRSQVAPETWSCSQWKFETGTEQTI